MLAEAMTPELKSVATNIQRLGKYGAVLDHKLITKLHDGTGKYVYHVLPCWFSVDEVAFSVTSMGGFMFLDNIEVTDRKKGIGSQVIQDVYKACTDAGITELYVAVTSGDADYRKRKRFFKKNGFRLFNQFPGKWDQIHFVKRK